MCKGCLLHLSLFAFLEGEYVVRGRRLNRDAGAFALVSRAKMGRQMRGAEINVNYCAQGYVIRSMEKGSEGS